MAGVGPAPKDNSARRNKGPEKTSLQAPNVATDLVIGDEALGPELPKGSWVLPEAQDWHPMTQQWWDHWRRSPQACRMLSQPDWDFLMDTALLHHVMWTKGRWEFASEVRIRVAKFGATPEDRMRLRQDIVVPDAMSAGDAPGASVTSLDSRRSRIKD